MLCSAWVTGADVKRRPDAEDIDQPIADGAALDASELLYALSGRQFPGSCEATVRPAARPFSYDVATWAHYLEAFGFNGGFSSSWGLCNAARFGLPYDHNGCARNKSLDLKVYPLTEVIEVRIDGEVLDNADGKAYRVDEQRWLIRQDGGIWPTCQDLTLPDGEVGTFAVDVVFGAEPTGFAKSAATTLAVELAKARSNKNNRLPRRIQSITREGVSMMVLDPMQFIQQGLTGIFEVDEFIRAYNPSRMAAPPTVWSPDVRPVVHAPLTS